jgi:hypothetical protein
VSKIQDQEQPYAMYLLVAIWKYNRFISGGELHISLLLDKYTIFSMPGGWTLMF